MTRSAESLALASCTVWQFTSENVKEHSKASFAEAIEYTNDDAVTWIHIPGRLTVKLLEKIGGLVALPATVTPRLLATARRPIAHCFSTLILLHTLYTPFKARQRIIQERPLSVIATKKLVVTVAEDFHVLQPIVERIYDPQSNSRRNGTDYLCYRILEEVVDSLVNWVDAVASRTASLESLVLDEEIEGPTLERVHHLRALSLQLRKLVSPLSEVFYRLERSDTHVISDFSRPHWALAHGHCRMLLESLDTQREILSGLMELHLSGASQRLNEVMKTLTIVATIFVPLTFIAGLYGMNFRHMPELEWQWGYPFALLSMILVAAGMCMYFRKKKWI